MAKRHEAAEYIVGLVAALAGALTVATFSRDTFPEWVPLIALVAAVGGAIGTFLNSKRLKNAHWSRHAGLGRLAQDYETLLTARDEPTKAEMRELSERWEQWHTGLSD